MESCENNQNISQVRQLILFVISYPDNHKGYYTIYEID